MRCKCCNADDARRWKGDYYCEECRAAVKSHLYDTHGDKLAARHPDTLIDKNWGDE